MLELLSDNHLLCCYLEAVELNLDPEFIDLLQNEMIRRNLSPEHLLESSST